MSWLLYCRSTALVSRQDVRRDDELAVRRVQGAEVGTEHHDGEVEVHVVVILLHALPVRSLLRLMSATM